MDMLDGLSWYMGIWEFIASWTWHGHQKHCISVDITILS